MTVSKIRYKGYSWQHNPKTLHIENQHNYIETEIPFSKSYVEKSTEKPRVVKGTGQLYGEDCIDQYNHLVNLRNLNGSGILSLPDIKPFYAYFKSIELICEPTDKCVSYSFVFVEDLNRNLKTKSLSYHKVNSGETLFDIAFMYNQPIENLVKLNPQIRRIDELEEIERVRLC